MNGGGVQRWLTGSQDPETLTDSVSSGLELKVFLPSWELSLRAENKAASTIRNYLLSAREFIAWLQAQGMPVTAVGVHREHVEAHLADLFARGNKDSSVATRHRHLKLFFAWLLAEGEITTHPMVNMKPPKIGETIIPVIDEAHIRALFACCTGNDFLDRRDQAIFRLFFDNGMRVSELAGMPVDAPQLLEGVVQVRGKGNKELLKPFGAVTARAIDRYLRTRAAHSHADKRWLWLGQRGRLTPDGIRQMMQRRAVQAGVPHIHPHLWRHTFADRWLSNDGKEGHLMRIMGWDSREMVDRYARSVADKRAREEFQRLRLGDDF